jgi:hypothetical protein
MGNQRAMAVINGEIATAGEGERKKNLIAIRELILRSPIHMQPRTPAPSPPPSTVAPTH